MSVSPQSSRDSSASPSLNVGSNHCISCNHTYTSTSNYNQHKPCRFRVVSGSVNISKAVTLKSPNNIEVVDNIMTQLCDTDKIKLCMSQNWFYKGIYPLVFPSANFGTDLFFQFTAGTNSSRLLRQYLRQEASITLPMNIILDGGPNLVHSSLGDPILHPANEFSVDQSGDSFVVTLCSPDGGGGGGGDDDSGDDSNDDWSEDSDDGSDEDSDDESDEDSDDELGGISYSRGPAPTTPVSSLSPDILALLPNDFQPGVDGQGKLFHIYTKIYRFKRIQFPSYSYI